MTFDADGHGGNSHGAQIEAAAGPLEAAMRSDSLSIGPGAVVRIDAGYWEPMIQIAPKRDLDDEVLAVSAAVSVGPSAPSPVIFERMTEGGTWLPIFLPAANTGRRTAAAIDMTITAHLNGTALSLTALRALVDVRIVEGLFARLLYVASAETARLRRQARMVHAAAALGGARGFVLDRYGQELGVPRLTDRLAAQGGEIVTVPDPENDAGYRRRLAVYRPWFMADRRAVLHALNGTATAPGPMQQIGGPQNFNIYERDNPLLSGLRIISVAANIAAAQTQRANFLAYLRATILIDPVVNVPSGRAMPRSVRIAENALRLRLRSGMTFADPNKRAMAPYLALAFDRLIGFLAIFAPPVLLQVTRAQADDGGNRHELGLGAEIARLTTTTLNAVRAALAAPIASVLSANNQAIVAALRGKDLSGLDGAWLLAACGFRTIENVTATRLFVSHLSMGALAITGPETATTSAAAAGVRYTAAIGSNVAGVGMALASALSGGLPGWPPGDPPWTMVPMAQLATTIAALSAPSPTLISAIAGSRVATVATSDLARFVEAVSRYPAGTVIALSLDPAFVTALSAGGGTAGGRWHRIIETLGANGAASAALFAGSGGVSILLVSAHGLPLLGSNIGARRATGYYWDSMAASSGADGMCRPSGTETTLRARMPGIYALHCLASARIGDTDPFEYRVDLPAGTTINLAQYEMLMNLLGRCYPVGIEINTWALRRSHVVLDGTAPVPLTPNQSRSFRRWQRPHFAGVELNRPDFNGG